ncbi:MAG: TMEM165/GDT1 family protein [Trebonia sp.]|jgi:putative Ca2+/H+ antiporter (TMEM165/GDT1 family)
MSPSLSEAAATFLAVLPGELPDKTILATLILSSRYRPAYVFAGAAAGFLVQVVISVAAGGALSLLPRRPVEGAAAAVFAIGAFLLWRHKEEKNPDADDEGGPDGMRDGFWPVFGTSFAVIFLAEFGDVTQFLTVSLAARFHNPVAVGVGATLALWTAAALAVLVGWRLLKLIPMHWLTRGAAVIMLILAGTSLYAALR